MCIKEGLRLYSPVHVIQREMNEDLEVRGMKIPKGGKTKLFQFCLIFLVILNTLVTLSGTALH